MESVRDCPTEYVTRPSHRNGMTRMTPRWRGLGATGAMVLSLSSSWVRVPAQRPAPAAPPRASPHAGHAGHADPTSAIAAVIRALATTHVDAHDAPLVATITRVYADRKFRPAWTDADGYTPGGESVRRAMREADDEGLDTAAYRVPAMESDDADAQARADVRLSFVALRFAQDLGWGVTLPDDVHRDHAYPRRHFDGDSLLRAWMQASDRAHSHGCIRVQRPRELAALLLADEGWSPARLDSAIAAGNRSVAWLRRPVPVHITYVTAFVDDDGVLQFRRDVYGRDALLQRVMRQAERRPLPAALE